MTRVPLSLGRRSKSTRTPSIVAGIEHILFLRLIDAAGFGKPTTEHRFDPDRRWRFDYAWPHVLIAIEVEGGAYSRGRHVRPKGFLADCEKYTEAAVQGWIVIRVPPSQLPTPETIVLLQRAFQLRQLNP